MLLNSIKINLLIIFLFFETFVLIDSKISICWEYLLALCLYVTHSLCFIK